MAETYSAKPLPDTQPHQATLSSRSPLPRYKTQPPHPYCSTPQSHSQDASSLSHMPTDHLPHSPHKPSLHGASLFDQACCPYPISLGCIANHPTPQLRPNCVRAAHNRVMPPCTLHHPTISTQSTIASQSKNCLLTLSRLSQVISNSPTFGCSLIALAQSSASTTIILRSCSNQSIYPTAQRFIILSPC